MRKMFLYLGVLLMAVSVCGCSSGEKLSDKENDSLAEYMAGTLLKHDKNYDQALTYEDEPEIPEETDSSQTSETPAPSPSPDTSEESDSPDSVVPMDSPDSTDASENAGQESACELRELYDVDGITISYDTFMTASSYPKGGKSSYYSVEAKKNHKLVVLKFDVMNSKNKKVMLNLLQSGVSYQLETSDGTVYKPLITLVVEDLQYLDYYVAGKDKDKAVLIFELPDNAKLSGTVFRAQKQDKVCKITIK